MSLGLQRGKVQLVPYNPQWVVLFIEEKNQIQSLLGEDIIGIEHIGSTAIPGMDAKPILDLMVAVDSLEDYVYYDQQFQKLGYTFRQDNRKNQEHILFVKGLEEKRTHYLKLTTLNSNFWREHILFRDYLMRYPERAEEYRRLKHQLLEQYAGERPQYTEDKAGFIEETIKLAEKEI